MCLCLYVHVCVRAGVLGYMHAYRLCKLLGRAVDIVHVSSDLQLPLFVDLTSSEFFALLLNVKSTLKLELAARSCSCCGSFYY